MHSSVILWCNAWKWKHLSVIPLPVCCCPSGHWKPGPQQKSTRSPDQSSSETFLQRAHGQNNWVDPSFSAPDASPRSLQVYKPGQWHSAPRAPIYSPAEFHEWNGPYHSARGETCAVWAHSRTLLSFNPYWTKTSTETEVIVVKPRAGNR